RRNDETRGRETALPLSAGSPIDGSESGVTNRSQQAMLLTCQAAALPRMGADAQAWLRKTWRARLFGRD
ncbi:MAG: hypothetical protein RSE33_21570, partial [Hafnia sp.]